MSSLVFCITLGCISGRSNRLRTCVISLSRADVIVSTISLNPTTFRRSRSMKPGLRLNTKRCAFRQLLTLIRSKFCTSTCRPAGPASIRCCFSKKYSSTAAVSQHHRLTAATGTTSYSVSPSANRSEKRGEIAHSSKHGSVSSNTEQYYSTIDFPTTVAENPPEAGLQLSPPPMLYFRVNTSPNS